MDASLKPDPKRKGSYYRRLQDIERALDKLRVPDLPPEIQFLAYYFGCEKFARGLVGIHKRVAADTAYDRDSVKLNDIQAASNDLSLSIAPDDMAYIFAARPQDAVPHAPIERVGQSARMLRNRLSHDFGPSNVALIAAAAGFYVPKMRTFLSCIGAVLEYQKVHFSSIP